MIFSVPASFGDWSHKIVELDMHILLWFGRATILGLLICKKTETWLDTECETKYSVLSTWFPPHPPEADVAVGAGLRRAAYQYSLQKLDFTLILRDLDFWVARFTLKRGLLQETKPHLN